LFEFAGLESDGAAVGIRHGGYGFLERLL
ncbi:MAG: hypothetical protein RL404_1285, partial [Pseudomonadota bacterium]